MFNDTSVLTWLKAKLAYNVLLPLSLLKSRKKPPWDTDLLLIHYLWRWLPLWVFTHRTDTSSTLHTKQIVNPQRVILWTHRHVTTHVYAGSDAMCLLPVYFRSPCEDFLAKVDLTFFRSQFTDLRWHRIRSKLVFFVYPILGAKLGISYNV